MTSESHASLARSEKLAIYVALSHSTGTGGQYSGDSRVPSLTWYSPSQMAGDLDFTASGTFAQNVVAELEALRRRVSILEKSSTSGNGVTSVVAVPSSRLDRPVRADSSNGDGMNDSSQDAGK